MNFRRFAILFLLTVVIGSSAPYLSTTNAFDPRLPAFQFVLEGAASPEEAAKALFMGCALESPKHLVKHLSLATCEGPVDTIQNFAECLNRTEFRSGGHSFNVYDLPASD